MRQVGQKFRDPNLEDDNMLENVLYSSLDDQSSGLKEFQRIRLIGEQAALVHHCPSRMISASEYVSADVGDGKFDGLVSIIHDPHIIA